MRAQTLRPNTTSTWIIGCLLVFILAQTLGWMHRGLHAIPHGSPVPVAGHALAPPAVGDHIPHSWTERLFAGHTEASDCRLYDALTHAEGVPVSPLALVVVPALAVTVRVVDVTTGRCTVPFDARGPPLSL